MKRIKQITLFIALIACILLTESTVYAKKNNKKNDYKSFNIVQLNVRLDKSDKTKKCKLLEKSGAYYISLNDLSNILKNTNLGFSLDSKLKENTVIIQSYAPYKKTAAVDKKLLSRKNIKAEVQKINLDINGASASYQAVKVENSYFINTEYLPKALNFNLKKSKKDILIIPNISEFANALKTSFSNNIDDSYKSGNYERWSAAINGYIYLENGKIVTITASDEKKPYTYAIMTRIISLRMNVLSNTIAKNSAASLTEKTIIIWFLELIIIGIGMQDLFSY